MNERPRTAPQTPAAITDALVLAEYEVCEALDILERVGGFNVEADLSPEAISTAFDYLCLARHRLKEISGRLGSKGECAHYMLRTDPRVPIAA